MDNEITNTVYESLKSASAKLLPTINEFTEVETAIHSNRFTEEYLRKTLYPREKQLRNALDEAGHKAIQDAHKLVEQYKKDAAEINCLDPAALTDDIRLLNSGISLFPRDIQAILKRNEGNRTMTQLVLRYAQEHDINIQGLEYNRGEDHSRIADALDGILTYYEKWITRNNNLEMLDRFFGVRTQGK